MPPRLNDHQSRRVLAAHKAGERLSPSDALYLEAAFTSLLLAATRRASSRLGLSWDQYVAIRPDVMDQATLLAWKVLPGFDPAHGSGAQPATYLYSCCRRRLPRWIKRAMGKLAGPQIECLAAVVDPIPNDPSSHAIQAELRETIGRVVASLPLRQRAAFELAMQGFTPADIAARLGLSPENVRVILFRIRTRLREELSSEAD